MKLLPTASLLLFGTTIWMACVVALDQTLQK